MRKPKPFVKCSAVDCPNKAKLRGYCRTHYERWRRGDRGDQINRPLQERGVYYQLPFQPKVPVHVASDLFDEAVKRDTSAYMLVREILTKWSDAYRAERGIDPAPVDGEVVEPVVDVTQPVPRRQAAPRPAAPPPARLPDDVRLQAVRELLQRVYGDGQPTGGHESLESLARALAGTGADLG